MYPELILFGYGVGIDLTNIEVDIYTPSHNCFEVNMTTHVETPITCYNSVHLPMLWFVILAAACFLIWCFRYEIFCFMRDHPVPFFPIFIIYALFNVGLIWLSGIFASVIFSLFYSIPAMLTQSDSEIRASLSMINTSISMMRDNGISDNVLRFVLDVYFYHFCVSIAMIIVVTMWYLVNRLYGKHYE